MMARNEIMFDYDDNGNLVVSGSQRKPTLAEAMEYLDHLIWVANMVKSMTLRQYCEKCTACGQEEPK